METSLDSVNKMQLAHEKANAVRQERGLAPGREGVGMPVIEAQASGVPVVTSNREPMLSVVGKGAVFVDPENVASMCEGVVRVLEVKALRDLLVAEGLRNSSRFAPERIAGAYAKVYREIASANREVAS